MFDSCYYDKNGTSFRGITDRYTAQTCHNLTYYWSLLLHRISKLFNILFQERDTHKHTHAHTQEKVTLYLSALEHWLHKSENWDLIPWPGEIF